MVGAFQIDAFQNDAFQVGVGAPPWYYGLPGLLIVEESVGAGFGFGTPFPAAGILDDFNRADENPLVGNWTNTGMFAYYVESQQLKASSGGSRAYWSTILGEEQEAFITMRQQLAVGAWWVLAIKVTSPPWPGSPDYIGFTFTENTGVIDGSVAVYVNNVAELNANFTVTSSPAANDRYGLRYANGVVSAWFSAAAGPWELKYSADIGYLGFTDSGYLELWSNYYDANYGKIADDFGGGEVDVLADQPVETRVVTYLAPVTDLHVLLSGADLRVALTIVD